ncbi:POU domain class 2-associating factor 1 [Plecturocebus cupreus]
MGSRDIAFHSHSFRTSPGSNSAIPGCPREGASEGTAEEEARPCQQWGSTCTYGGGAASSAPGDLHHSPSCLDMEVSASAVTEEGALCAGWLSPPTPATLQPLAPWTPYTEYVPHEAVSCPYSADMYVQPVCPSYTVVGPSSVLTYASPPLITNVTTRSSATPAVGPPLEGPEHQAPLTYFPWPQPLSTLPTSTLQYQPPAPALPGPQFVQLPISIPEPVLQDMEDPRRATSSLTIDKLLLEEEDSDAYALNHTLSVEGF